MTAPDKLSIDDQVAWLMQGSDYGDEITQTHMAAELRERLLESHQTGRPLRVYLGVDPTSADLHLGHSVPLRKLHQFQQLGHQAIFVIGTFTALVGDPSDRDQARPRQTEAQIKENARTYAEQAFRILDPDETEIRYNADWLSKLSFKDVIELASYFTIQQFLARENFSKRLDRGEAVWLHEVFYALMQGYDSVVLESDVELGATEQLFNLLAGRKLQEAFGQRAQIAITLPILVGTDGHERMSKSTGNYIGITEPPEVMYGKVMSIPDEAMLDYYRLVTRFNPAEIAQVERALADGSLHPRDAKMKLAFEIVESFQGSEAAQAAQAHFRRVFQQGKIPTDIPAFRLARPTNVIDLLSAARMVRSKSEGRRLIQGGGVRLDGERVDSIGLTIDPPTEARILQVGKRKWLRLEKERQA